MSVSEDALVIFPDTNSLLHYPPLKDVDWKSVCNAKTVVIMMCMDVIHELDQKKSDNRFANRASRIIAELDALLDQPDGVRDGVSLSVFNFELRAADFPDTLSPDSADDRIIHSLKKYLEVRPGVEAAIYTEDMGMRLRAAAHGVKALKPDVATRLENPTSEKDRKYKEAVAELQQHKNRQPQPRVVISLADSQLPEEKAAEFVIPLTYEERDLDKELQTYRSRPELQPWKVDPNEPSIVIDGTEVQNDDYDKYNAELGAHFRKYQKWLERDYLSQRITAHSFVFSIWLVNSGGAPADDLDLEITFSSPVVMLKEGDVPTDHVLKPKKPPRVPTTPSQLAVEMLTATDGVRRIMSSLQKPAHDYSKFLETKIENKPTIEQDPIDGSICLTYNVPRLKHHSPHCIANFVASLLPEKAGPFRASCRIMAANLAQPVIQTLNFIVRRADIPK